MAARFQDKVVIITGANNGIGAATAAIFASQGARIAALDIREPQAIEANPNRLDIKCNVAVEEEVMAAVKAVVDRWGTIDVLCNVAGITDRFEPVTEITQDHLNLLFGVNLNGPIYLMKHVIPHFLAKPGEPIPNPYGPTLPATPPFKGSIVNVCSTAAIRGASAGALYTASKHALLGLSRNTAWMYAKQGVRTNTVAPGGVFTNIMANSGVQPQDYSVAGYTAIKPFHDTSLGYVMPTDVAATIVYLAGADGINGAEVTVDQGWTA